MSTTEVCLGAGGNPWKRVRVSERDPKEVRSEHRAHRSTKA